LTLADHTLRARQRAIAKFIANVYHCKPLCIKLNK